MNQSMDHQKQRRFSFNPALFVAVLAVAAVVLLNVLHPPASVGESLTTNSDPAASGTTMAAIGTTAPTPTQTPEPAIFVLTHAAREMSNGLESSENVDFEVVDSDPVLKYEFPGNWGIYCQPSGAYWGIRFVGAIVPEALQDTAVILDVKTNYGDLMHDFTSGEYTYSQAHIGKQAILDAGQAFLWQGDEINSIRLKEEAYDYDMSAVLAQIGRVWVDILVKVDGNIVGCLVFEMVNWKNLGLTVEYVGSDYYPPMDGQYQAITEEFVRQRIDAYHQAIRSETGG